MKLFTVKGISSLRGSIFRVLALVLALMAASQVLPVTFSVDEFGGLDGEDAVVLTLRPLKICDGGPDVTGFLSDHPWVSAAGASPLIPATGITFVLQTALSLPEGMPTEIYHPPRTVRS